MYKIRKIKFKDHPILKNLELDFCDINGNAVDTIIIAGENGTGKSTIINCLYGITSMKLDFECNIEIENEKGTHLLTYVHKNIQGSNMLWVQDNENLSTLPGNPDFKQKYDFSAIFSDVDINFSSQNITSVTSLDLDITKSSRRSSTDLPKQINQLLIDIQALDDTSLATAVREVWNTGTVAEKSKMGYDARMPRFTKAFNTMFEKLTYSRVTNQDNHKAILFQKNGEDIPIEKLSSGEKQIVYRGCFLLKDANAMNGAFVFIDEPEISLHPNWQIKIMDYYKGIFTNDEGIQTSQIFAVTHSPFVIHNDNRKNDKVIVLARDESGDIIVKDKPEYFKCDSMEVVQDAFSIQNFSSEQATVYLEGQTDVKYFNRALQVFKHDVPFAFKWVGYVDQNGQEVNTGDKSVDKAFHFLVAQNLEEINVCLKDCDTNRQLKRIKNVIATSIPKYKNTKGMEKGIENALVLDDIDLSPYYINKEKTGNYGEKTQYQEFDKMACCEGICSMDDELLKKVFVNLNETIEYLIDLYRE